jgi:hypothetical protein
MKTEYASAAADDDAHGTSKPDFRTTRPGGTRVMKRDQQYVQARRCTAMDFLGLRRYVQVVEKWLEAGGARNGNENESRYKGRKKPGQCMDESRTESERSSAEDPADYCAAWAQNWMRSARK